MGSGAYQNPTITINSNLGNVTDSYKNVWNNCEISVSDERRQVLEWLSPLAPRERHRAVSDGRMDGVGDWLLGTNEFRKWHTSEDQSVHPVLFCYGDPGVGKTYLSSLVIDTLCNSIGRDNAVVACVYCDFHAHKEQSAPGVLAALLKQLAAGVETIPEAIKEAFERAKREVDGRTLRLPEIRAMLVKSISSLRRGFICIDALDEFPTIHRTELWESLQHIARECPNIRLFITGRPHIREEMKKYFPGYPDVAPIKPTKEDIRGYITMRLKKDSQLDAMDTELEADIVGTILEKISGAFLLVSLIMDAVLEDATIHQRRLTLYKMTNGTGLEDAYRTTLDRIREQKGSKVKLGMEALMWISRSERPLKAEELCHALAVEVGTSDLNVHNVPSIRILLSCTLGLIAVDEQTSTVRLIHFTLQEYLAAHPNLFMTPHSMMAEICLTYLNFRSVCEISTTLDSIPLTTPFLHYASCYWGLHARKEITEGVKQLALRHLQRDASHISVDILLREEAAGFLSWWERFGGRHPDLRGFTGLHCISYIGVAEIAIEMVNMKRWDLNSADSNGATPLIWAAKHGNYTLARLLLEQADVNPTLSDKQGLTPLARAAKGGHEDTVRILLEQGDVNPDARDKFGSTPLSYAAGLGHQGVLKILLERGHVHPDSSNNDGRTPLSHAAGLGREGVVNILLEQGEVNSDSADEDGRTPLSWAAESGHEGVMKILLQREDVNPDSSDEDGRTPLSWAAESGHERVVKIFLQRRDVNSDSLDKASRTPLSWAAESGHEDVVKLLLGRGDVNPNSQDNDGRVPLSWAAEFGHEGVVKILLARRDVDPGVWDNFFWTPLSYATGLGHEGVVNILLEREEICLNSADLDGRTPLALAAGSGHERIVEVLLEWRGIFPDGSGVGGRTPLSWAAESGHEGVVKILLERGGVGPDWPDHDGRTPLSWAAESGYDEVVKILLGRGGVNPDSPDHNGQTPLSWAAESGYEDVVKILLGYGGVNPNSLDKAGRTPLSWAAESGCADVVKILLEAGGVNPDSPDEDGRTPLSWAAESGNDDVVKILLQREDVKPDLPDNDAQTPLSWATESGYDRVVKILLQRGDVNPNSSDKDGRTPLSWAAEFGHERPVKILLRRGDVNPNLSDEDSQTPLSYAAGSGHEGVVKILLGYGGANPNSSDARGMTLLSSAVLAWPCGVMSPPLEPRPFSRQISPNIDLAQQFSVSAVSVPEGGDAGLVSKREGRIPDTRHDVTEVTFPHSDKTPQNQLEATPSASFLTPTPTSNTASDLAIPLPSGPLKRRGATPPLLYPSKRQHSTSS